MMDKLKHIITQTVEEHMEGLKDIRTYLYENPEVGGEEEKAYAVLTKAIEEQGFEMTYDFHNIDYCFKAEFDSGKAGPVIGLTAEYDALPEIGHGCGHNIICTAAMGAAFALKEVVKETGGKVILFGTPAEECFVKKVQLAEEGAFGCLDIAMTVHPNPFDLASGKTTAIDAWQVDFYGKSAHAGAHPEEGINALDAAVHFYSLVGFEKQYLKDTNIYGVFASGGEKCSVIPDFAAVKYLVRANTVGEIGKIREMFERCAESACLATGATYRIWNNEPGNMDMVTNYTLSNVFNEYYEELADCKMIHEDSTASTDMGDVSHVVPTIHPWIGLGCPDLKLHSLEFAQETITKAGDDAIKNGAIAMALTGARVLTNPTLLAEIKAEFEEAKKCF